MTDVFIVLGNIDYEFGMVIGVFDNAEAAKNRATSGDYRYDSIAVMRWRVGDMEESETLLVVKRAD